MFALQDWTDFDAAATAKMREVVENRCRDDRWSDETHACYRAMRRENEHARCDSLLTVAQKDALDRDLKKSFPRSGEPAPDDSVATTVCPTSGSIVVKTSSPDLCAPATRSLPVVPAVSGYEVRVLQTSLVATGAAVSCKVFISARSNADVLVTTWSSASTAGTERDCVDAVVEALIAKKIGPLVQRHSARSP